MSNINPKIFKAYDVRGIYSDEFNEEAAYAIGQALVRFLENHSQINQRKLAVGRDVRLSSPAIFDAFAQGIISQGADVLDLGLCSTPLFYWALINEQASGGAQITASHNPADYNGLKICANHAVAVGLENGLNEIRELAEQVWPTSSAPGKIIKKKMADAYTNFVFKHFNLAAIKPLKIIIDCGNGMAGPEVKKIFSRLTCQVGYLYDESNGAFPNHEANPSKEETLRDLKARVLDTGADLGMAFDGDADRIAFVDEKGETVRGDFIVALLAQELLIENPDQKILYEVRSSKIIPEVVARAGGQAILGRAGHSLIKEQMRRENILFGGELSGHYFYRDLGFVENTLFTMLKMLEIISQSNQDMSSLVAPLKKYATSGEINFKVNAPDEKLSQIEKHFAEASVKKIDGLTIQYPDWWFNLRKSNTEPLVRLNIEADNFQLLEEKKRELAELINN